MSEGAGVWSSKTETLNCGIQCFLHVNSVRIELNLTPSWCWGIACWCETSPPHAGIGCGIFYMVKFKKQVVEYVQDNVIFLKNQYSQNQTISFVQVLVKDYYYQ